MATTENFYTGNASTTSFGYSFPILQNSDLKVELAGVLKTENTSGTNNDYSISGTNVVFNSAPANGVDIHIYRLTDVDSPKAVFAAGSSIRAGDLNNIVDQALFANQEQQQKIRNADIRNDAVTADKIADDQINSEHYVAGSIDLEHMSPNSIDSDQYVDGSIDHVHLSNDCVDGDNIQDDSINSEHYVAGSIDLEHMSPNSVDSDQYVDGSIDHVHLSNDCIDSDNIQDNAINSEHYVNASIDRVHLEADIIDSTKLADDAVGAEHIQANAVTDSEIATGTLDNRYFTETELTGGALDGRYYTETEAEAKFLRQDSSETIASGVSWSNSDAFVATTAAINARIIDLIDEVGGFTAIANETSFPTTNPQGATGQAAILSIQSASTTLTPQSGTTLTIANGAGSGNTVTITGVPTAIPQNFGFLVESTSTTHTYSFHRLVPIATQVNTVAQNITNIVNAGANVTDINNFADLYQISNSAPTQRADGTSLQEGDLWYDSSNDNLQVYDGSAFAAVTPTQQVLADIAIVSGAITYSEDLGLITGAVTTGSSNGSLDIVADVLEDEITFTTTVVNSGGNKYVIDGDTSNPAKALTLYKGWTYTFDQSDSSNANHPLVFKTDSGSYTTNVTVTGTAGQAGAKVSIKIPESQPTGFRYYCSVHGNSMGNTITVKDDPLKTVSDDITKIQTVADNINNLNTVQGISSNVTTVAGIASNVTAVAGNATNINAVAADATDIGAVAGKATEIGRLGTADAVADLAILGTNAIVSDMDTLADISSNITTVAGISSNVTSVAGNASNINSAVSNASNINSAVSNASNINSAVSNASNINTVAGISSNVTTVAGISSNVTAVANDAADIGAVAGKATEIGRLGTADAVADLAILGTTDVVSDMNTLATSANVTAMDNCSDDIANINTVAGSISNVNTTAGSISNVNTVASNISAVNNFANTYRIGSSNPTTSLDVGDLFFNTSANELRVYNGTQWQGGVTATGNLSQVSGSVFTGDNRYNDNVKAKFGTDSDLQIFHNTTDSIINASGTGNIKLQDQGNTKLEITSSGISATGNIVVSGTVDGRDLATDGTKLDGIEASATADQTAAEIRTLVESASNSNVFTDADHSKLNGIEASATADQTASEIVALISGQTIAPNVITTTNLTLDFGTL